MARAATTRPRPISDPTHNRDHRLTKDYARMHRIHLESISEDIPVSHPRNELEQPSKGVLTSRYVGHRHSAPAEVERPTAQSHHRRSGTISSGSDYRPQDANRRAENREDALAQLCGDHQPEAAQQRRDSATHHAMERTRSEHARSPPSADQSAGRGREKPKRVTFNSRDDYHEFIVGERPMRDPKVYGASRPAHRQSPPPHHGNLRTGESSHVSLAKSHRDDAYADHPRYPSPPPMQRKEGKEQNKDVQRTRSDKRKSRAFMKTPEAEEYLKANPDAYTPVNVYDPSFVDEEKALEEEKKKKEKEKESNSSPYPPPAFMQYLPDGTVMVPSFYAFPHGPKEKKANPLARLKDKLIEMTSEPDYPDLPSANRLAKRISVPRDENGEPKLPWELSSKCRVHDPRKYVVKKKLRQLPKYVSQLKVETAKLDEEKAARIRGASAANERKRGETTSAFHHFLPSYKKATERHNSQPTLTRARTLTTRVH